MKNMTQMNCRILVLVVLMAASNVHAQMTPNYTIDERDSYHDAHVYHVMVRTQAEAAEIYTSLRGVPKDRLLPAFKAAAKAKSIDPGSSQAGGDLGVIKEGTMVRPFEKVAFSTPKGQMGGPVQTEFGWHLLYVQSANSIPATRLCAQTLEQTLKTTPGVPSDAIVLTKGFKAGSSSQEKRIQKLLGPAWGPAMKDGDGNLTFLKVEKSDGSGVTELLQHTEYPYGRLHISPLACKRSVRFRYEVNCPNGTVQLRSYEEMELRGGQGPVANRSTSASWNAIKPTPGAFFQQLQEFACNPKRKA